ncbi:MAG TPA: hypothetical protein PLP17_12215 [Oligoflexia bacterium]|nr:hypothetical protein [Oligoflexia bacterium]
MFLGMGMEQTPVVVASPEPISETLAVVDIVGGAVLRNGEPFIAGPYLMVTPVEAIYKNRAVEVRKKFPRPGRYRLYTNHRGHFRILEQFPS